MKYISQLNGFWNWRALNGLTSKQADLYMAILSVGNETGWKSPFNIPNSNLVGRCSMSLKELYRVRNALVQKGLIEYENGKKGTSGLYTIVPLYDESLGTNLVTNIGTNVVTNMGTNVGTNMVTIPRVRVRERKEDAKASKKSPETVFAEYAQEDEKLMEAFRGYAEMRKQIKKPLTVRATEMLIKKLEALSADGNPPDRVLDQSTFSNWQGVFPLKDGGAGNAGTDSGYGEEMTRL